MAQTNHQLSVQDAYHHLYDGETILLKVSGEEHDSPDFQKLAGDISAMARLGIRFIIVCGAGQQNTQYYNEHLALQRKKPHEPTWHLGSRVTSLEELQYGVLPAAKAIGEKIARLIPGAIILDPRDILCEPLPQLGYVGSPQIIYHLHDHDKNIVALLPVGYGFDCNEEQEEGGLHEQKAPYYGSFLNVNADELALAVAEQARVVTAIFFTPTGGVMDTRKPQKPIIPLLWGEDINSDGSLREGSPYGEVSVSGGGGKMQKKLRHAKEMLGEMLKVVITGLANVRGEIEQVLGSGTMIIRKETIRRHWLTTAEERSIFHSLYGQNVLRGAFLPRNEAAMEELLKHVHLIGVSNSILGAFALIPHDDWMELATVCSEYNGSGIGDVLVKHAQQQALDEGKRHIYSVASSPGMAAILEGNGFTNHGTLLEVQHRDPSAYFHLPFVWNYNVEKRGRSTFLCTWHAGIDSINAAET
ncbi:MAG: GNAT family N-acetyltransferase [Candidatus Peregrinibacteria bacterium]